MNTTRHSAARNLSRRAPCVLLGARLAPVGWADEHQGVQKSGLPLKHLSLAELGSLEVTVASKEPEQVWKTPA